MSDSNSSATETRDKNRTSFNVRDQLGSLDAVRRYDTYLIEHKRRLRQLEKEARGEMSPSGEWYGERR